MTESNYGHREGMARAMSQLLTYPFEAKKACLQVGKASVNCYQGMFQSSITAGIVFGSYYHVYHNLNPHPLASCIASFVTSFIKIPIGNCIRVLQLNPQHTHLVRSGKKILQKKGIKGLYNGYGLSMIEDMIESYVRETMYIHLKHIHPNHSIVHLGTGAISGAVGAAVTTPLDTLRTHLAHASIYNKPNDLFYLSRQLIHTNGYTALFRGIHLRAFSCAVRYALFYSIMEALYLF